MHRPVLPADEAAGCPASCIFPPSPGCVSGLPRTSLPFLSRRPNPQVAPWLRSFDCAGDGPFELPRASHAFGGAGFGRVPSFPGGSHFLRSAPDVGLGFPLILHLRLYRRSIIESPRFSHPSAVPSCRSSSCLESQPFGIADDSSPKLP
jgi:hypothetical protein